MKKISLEDLYKLKLVSDARISPSGKKVAFAVGMMDRKKDDYFSRIYLWDGVVKEFTSGEKDTAPRFTSDEKYLVYLSKRDKKVDIRKISIKGGESKRILTRERILDIAVDGKFV